jgi:hypothetical protein
MLALMIKRRKQILRTNNGQTGQSNHPLIEYDVILEVTEDEGDFNEEIASHQPKCYYVMHNSCVES